MQIELSLLHLQLLLLLNLEGEDKIDAEVKTWLSFATQKLKELAAIAKASDNDDSLADFIAENKKAVENRKTSAKIHNEEVKKRAANVTEADKNRKVNILLEENSRKRIGSSTASNYYRLFPAN